MIESSNATGERLESLFQPCITVTDDGAIAVDFADSYINTVDLATGDEVEENDPHGHANVLDGILGDASVSTADKLRRLAAHIEASGVAGA